MCIKNKYLPTLIGKHVGAWYVRGMIIKGSVLFFDPRFIDWGQDGWTGWSIQMMWRCMSLITTIYGLLFFS